MSTAVTDKIEDTDEAWESGRLGTDAAYCRVASADMTTAIDSSLGLQAISIRLPKELIDAYKFIAAHHGVGYQPLMRDILQRFVPEGLKEVITHHAVKANEIDTRLDEWRKAA